MSFQEKIKAGIRWPLVWGLLAALALGMIPAWNAAQEAGNPSTVAVRASPGAKVFEQKHRLLKRLLEDLERKLVMRQADLEKTRQLLFKARTAAENGRNDLSEKLTGKAFASATRLARILGPSEPSQAELRSRYEELSGAVAKFRAALIEAALEKGQDVSQMKIAEVDSLLEKAAVRAANREFKSANVVLSLAYKIVAENLASVRANETVVQRLVFESPAEEYRYEQNRYDSHELLVRLVLNERELEEAILRQVHADVDAAAALHRVADGHQRRGDHDRALQSEEAAVDRLIDALGKSGLFVPR